MNNNPEDTSNNNTGQENNSHFSRMESCYMQLAAATLENQRMTREIFLNQSSRQAKVTEPDTYDGRRSANTIDAWTRGVEKYGEFFSWDPNTVYKYATTLLRGRAELWHSQLEPTVDDWTTFKNLLMEEFRPTNADLIYRDQLAAIRQDGNMESYVNSFMDICLSLPDLTDDEKCDKFMRGVESDGLRAELRNIDRRTRTIGQFYSIATNYAGARVFATTQDQRKTSSSSHYDPMDLDAIQQSRRTSNYQNNRDYNYNANQRYNNRYRGGRGRGFQGNRGGYNGGRQQYHNTLNPNIQCFTCGNLGHYARQCALNNNQGASSSTPALQPTRPNVTSHVPSSSLNLIDLDTADMNQMNTNAKDNKVHDYSRYACFDILCNDKNCSEDASPKVSHICYNYNKLNTAAHPFELKPIYHNAEQRSVIFELDTTLSSDLMYIAELMSLKTRTELPLYDASLPLFINHRNIPVKVLIDTGATECYISPGLANLVDGQRKQVSRQVETAGGAIDSIDEQISFQLDLQGHTAHVPAFVYATKFDVILGNSWLKANKAFIKCEDASVTFEGSSNNHKILPTSSATSKNIKTVELNSIYDSIGEYLISSKQVHQLRKSKDVDTCLLYVVDKPEGKNDLDEFSSIIIKSFPSVFQDNLSGLPPDRGFQHVINTQDASPVNRQAFRMSPVELDELKKQLKQLLDLGLIQPSSSPWGAPVLFCRKKTDNTLRMCIDYRALNALTLRNSSPLPRIDECLDRLKGARYFTSLDLKSGYHQIRIHQDDIPKTAFNTRYGKYEFLVLPFGLSNAPPSFQTWMNELLGDFVDKFALVYLDDVLIYSHSMQDHLEHVKKVLERFENAGLVVNRAKCHFAKEKLIFLGFEVSGKGILPSANKVAAVKDWPIPQTVQQVRQFLGLSQHYRRFIPNFSSIASPLTDLTKGTGHKKRAINWSQECQTSFNKIKSLLTSAPLLQVPDMSRPFVIETDSSDFGVGAVLLQPASDDTQSTVDSKHTSWHPVAYESKKLSAEEQKFPAQERELIGIVHALRTWRCFIDGCQGGYVVFSDHNPLVYFRQQAKPTPRLIRWISELEMYSPIIKYKPGSSNTVADALSRICSNTTTQEKSERSLESDYLYSLWDRLSPGMVADWPLLYINKGEEKVSDPELKALLLKERDKFVTQGNVVFRKVKIQDENKKAWEKQAKFIPFSERADLVSKYHEDYGHASFKSMVNLLNGRYWWPSMRKDIEEWIAPCPSCQVNSKKITTHQEPMHPLPVPHAFERWHLDFVGELPLTVNGNKWLITAVDYTTNWPVAQALPVASKEAVADFIYKEIVMKFGSPKEIITDRGQNFCSGLVQAYLKRVGINHKLTSAFHPRTNSKVERYNAIIKGMLRKYVQGSIHRWDDFVDTALWATRVRVHSTTGFSPYFLTYGRQPNLPSDPNQPYVCKESMNDPRTVADLTARELESLKQHRAAAEFRLKAMSEKDKARWDAAIKPIDYEIGDMVLITHEGKFGLEPNYKGPYIITQVLEDYGTCRLETIQGEPLKSLVHKDRLKLAKGPKPTVDWYNPNTSRAEVKQITSTRSGRGGEGHHVVVQKHECQDFIDPIVASLPAASINTSTYQNCQASNPCLTSDKPDSFNQDKCIDTKATAEPQDEQEKWFEAMENSSMDSVINEGVDKNRWSLSSIAAEDKQEASKKRLQQILDGYDSISSTDNIMDEDIYDASSSDHGLSESSPGIILAENEQTSKCVSNHSPSASVKTLSSAAYLQQKQQKKRIKPTSVHTNMVQVAVPIKVPTNKPVNLKEKFTLPGKSDFTYRSKPLLPPKFHGKPTNTKMDRTFLARPTNNAKDTTANEWGHSSLVSEGGIVAPTIAGSNTARPPKLHTRPRFTPVTPARYKRQRLFNLALGIIPGPARNNK